MPDYSRYRTPTLEKMKEKAWDKYYAATTKPVGNWGDGMRLAKLPRDVEYEKSRERYYAICAELERRRRGGCSE